MTSCFTSKYTTTKRKRTTADKKSAYSFLEFVETQPVKTSMQIINVSANVALILMPHLKLAWTSMSVKVGRTIVPNTILNTV